ncbi:Gp49 family protein [Clostridium cellulovorans]|uniref:Uncharacterized protein n=1 Tax=Clostridium cellulovorans (strain ATCC 35296 / DSM 3052 / OCM 3 / 743B) TaxID=573061 RepID=D9SWD9_CLOC7|nr:Gp49 family protein [Clostridium cellulovorans]ADL53221.1 hypothetical protein Clocel_3545 [Clostridium cellulovorans 743B]
MNYYIGTKLIKAEPMTKGQYNECMGYATTPNEDPTIDGYRVQYPDGYVSWSPGCVFEKAYLKVDDNPNLFSGVSIGPQMVENFIKEKHISTIGEKTTLVRVVLVNGFEIIESSACVDKSNYDENIGAECCMKKIKDKIWMLLGFLLQTAYKGIK